MNVPARTLRRAASVFALCALLLCAVPALASAATLRAPRMKQATCSAGDKLLLSWSASSGAKGYTVYRAATATARTRTVIAKVKGTSLSYLPAADKSGAVWYYSVRATAGKRISPFSAATLAVSKWAPPTVTTPQVQPDGKVRLSWGELPGATGYSIWSAATESMAGATAVTTSAATADLMPLSDTDPTYYQVAATNRAFTGPKSAVVVYTPQVEPPSSVTYRALVVGNGDYEVKDDLKPACYNDAEQFAKALGLFKSDGAKYSKLIVKKDIKNAEVLPQMAAAFAGADEDDFSLLYYSGRSAMSGGGALYLSGVDSTSSSPGLDVSELAATLDRIPGRVLAIIDTPITVSGAGSLARGAAFEVARVPQTKATLMFAVRVANSSDLNKKSSQFTCSLLKGMGWDQENGARLEHMYADTDTAVNPGADADGKVSVVEAFTYAQRGATAAGASYIMLAIAPEGVNFTMYAR